jgi:hypothetical protein
MIEKVLLALALVASAVLPGVADARCGALGCNGTGSNPNSHYVREYTTRDGRYVPPHYQTNPNRTQYDNYGTRGNFNPHNGRIGTKDPEY